MAKLGNGTENNPVYSTNKACLEDTLDQAVKLAEKYGKTPTKFWIEAEHSKIETEDYSLIRKYFRTIDICIDLIARGYP